MEKFIFEGTSPGFKTYSEYETKVLVNQLCSALDYVLKFSSINYKWPIQKRSILDLIKEGREYAGDAGRLPLE